MDGPFLFHPLKVIAHCRFQSRLFASILKEMADVKDKPAKVEGEAKEEDEESEEEVLGMP